MADTLRDPVRYGAGPFEQEMPFLHSLAEAATPFPKLIASSPWTAPSHAALLGGINPWERDFHSFDGPKVPPVSLATQWDRAGGESVAFSCNSLASPAFRSVEGYGEFNPGMPIRAQSPGLWKIFTLLTLSERLWRPTPADSASPWEAFRGTLAWGLGSGIAQSMRQFRGGGVLNRYLADHLAARTSKAPLHIFLNFMEPHEPYRVPWEAGAGVRPAYRPALRYSKYSSELVASPQSPELLFAGYRQSTTLLDGHLRATFDLLRKTGVLDDALVLVTSDHGQSLGESSFYGHGHMLHETLSSVPAYLWRTKGGAPHRFELGPTDWLDHRHLHQLLLSFPSQFLETSLAEPIQEVQARVGPAVCHWAGPCPSEASRTHPADVTPFCQAVMVRQGTQVAEIRSGHPGGTGPDPGFSPSPPGSPPSELAGTILEQTSRQQRPKKFDPYSEVAKRLAAWGYD